MSKDRFKLIPAVYIILRRGDEVLLSQRMNTGYQDGKYSLIAGHLDGDELATEGMIREAREEAGIVLRPEQIKFAHVAHRLSRGSVGQERLDLFFEAWDWEGEPTNMEPEKCGELKWVPIENLPTETLPLIKLVIGSVLKGNAFSEYTIEPED